MRRPAPPVFVRLSGRPDFFTVACEHGREKNQVIYIQRYWGFRWAETDFKRMSMTLDRTYPDTGSAPERRTFAGWMPTRVQAFVVVFLVCFSNGIYGIAAQKVLDEGIASAIFGTFGLSAIVWAAIWFAVKLAFEEEDRPLKPWEAAAALACISAAFLPIAQFSSLALTVFAGLAIVTSRTGTPMHRASWIMFATTVPIFWGRRVMAYFSETLLGFDAAVVANMLGTERNGNLVPFPNGEGMLQVMEACSSLSNISLAILCWTIFTQVNGRRWQPSNLVWVGGAILSVVAINATRIALIGVFPHYYDLLHGPVGATVANYVILFAIVGICSWGNRVVRSA